jgi:hypothetical protein
VVGGGQPFGSLILRINIDINLKLGPTSVAIKIRMIFVNLLARQMLMRLRR